MAFRNLVAAALLALAACGGSDGAASITMDANGFSSHAVTVGIGRSIDFVNRDTAQHQIASSGCAALNGPVLSNGQSFTATVGNTAATCEVHDGLNPTSAAFQATITVSASAGGGGGY